MGNDDIILDDKEREALKVEFGLSDSELDANIERYSTGDDQENNRDDIPRPQRKDDILLFLRDVLKIKSEENHQLNRTGNLSESELGHLVLNTRVYNNIANYAATEGYDKVQNYLYSKSSNIITTSTSKKGFFLQLITTTKKINQNVLPKQIQRSSSLFGGTKEVVSGGDES